MEKGDDPYEILGVSKDADQAEIRKAYRKMALKSHPDKQKTEEDKAAATSNFAKVSGAYEILSDPVMKRDYDEQQEEEGSVGFDGEAEYDYDCEDYDFDPNAEPATDVTTLAMATENTGKKWFGGGKQKPKKKGGDPTKRKKKKPVHFSDPYSVFKRAFEAEWGVAYPGAEFDNVKGRDHMIAKAEKPLALTNGEEGEAAADDKNDSKDGHKDEPKKEKKGLFGMFKKKKNPEDETALVIKKDDNQIVSKKDKKKDNQLATAGSKGAPPGNNLPTSMEEKTYTRELPDGRIETITELTIKRPDGSTETMRRTDCPDSDTGNWNEAVKKSEPKNKLLTDGGKGETKMLENGGKEKQKQLTNGDDGDEKKKKSSKPNTRKKLGGSDKKKLAIEN